MSAETLCELDPALTSEQVLARYRYPDFGGFLESYKWVVSRLCHPGDYALATRRLLERLAAENVVYAEITLSAGVVLRRGQDFPSVFEAILAECRASSVRTAWILDAVRQFGADHVLEVARLAAAWAGRGAVGFGIGGDETLGPAVWFTEAFRLARSAGLRITVHAGETAGPESVWGALELGAERIGHGFRAAEDPALVAHLRDRGTPLEICLSSNVATGAVPRLAEHPVRRLYDAGVPITLNTDDPAMFHTTLSREYELAEALGFSPEELLAIAGNAFRYAFT